MLIDLLSTSNYVSYNIKVAQVFGLHTAIYLGEVMNINDKALRKQRLEGGCVILDRDYIASRTFLDKKEQKQIDEMLLSVGVMELNLDEPDAIKLNLNTLVTLMMSPDETVFEAAKKASKVKAATTRKTKTQAIIDNVKAAVLCNNDELRKAYFDWIDSVFAKQGWMSKKSVECGQKSIDDFSQRNLDVALQVLAIAAMNGYRDIEWAINTYKKDHAVTFTFKRADILPPVEEAPVELSSEVF